MTPTPILDRLAPLPQPIPRRSGMTVVFVVWSFVLLALVTGLLLNRPPVLRTWLLNDAPSWIDARGPLRAFSVAALTVALVSLVMVAVHETGHVLGGLAVGFRFKSIRVGPFCIDRTSGPSFRRGWSNAVSGNAVVIPATTDRMVQRGYVLLAAGPCANIVSGCAVLLLPVSLGFTSVLFVIQSIANGLSDLLPYRNRLGVSDGMFLRALYKEPAQAERWLALMRLSTEVTDGVYPEQWPREFIDKAIAVRDDSLDTVAAHAFAFSNAFHQFRNPDAALMLETCLRHAGHAPAPLREALMSEAAVFQAKRNLRTDLAEQWLADIPPTTQMKWVRIKAEAAILEAKGNAPAAAQKLDDCEENVTHVLNGPQRQHVLRLLRRWKSELTAPAIL